MAKIYGKRSGDGSWKDGWARAGCIGAAVALAALLSSPQASAQEAAKPGARWIVRCSNAADPARLACQLSQSLVDARTRARVLTVSVVPAATGDELRMRVGLPHGADLPKGVALSVDGGVPQSVAIATADANGSYADLVIGTELLASLRAGRVMKVSFASSGGQDIALDVDLTGFSAALDLMPR